MTEEIEKMLIFDGFTKMDFISDKRLNDDVIFCTPKTEDGLIKLLEYSTSLKRGFLKLMEQRDYYKMRLADQVEFVANDDAELEAAMKGEENK